ncbi:MAG: Co2+/Mg2+ efflux protein ApaG [Acidocella sp.]|nr:Co2+/Mg2+ efflux protein ApaG [Acidocella sp.]
MENAFLATTAGIKVAVRVFYLGDQSRPEAGHFVWAYRVTIDNMSGETVQLLKRTWRITDALGKVQLVHGDGVVGEQPVLKAGASFEYTSGTPLGTSSGFMTGEYHMIRVDKSEPFDIAIPAFSLDSPYQNTWRH